MFVFIVLKECKIYYK